MTIEELSQLSDEELRVKVAEKMGWKPLFYIMKRGLYYLPNGNGYTLCESKAWKVTEDVADNHVYPYHAPVTKHRAPLPPFSTSLDAMHEAEKALNEEQAEKMATLLMDVPDGDYPATKWVYHATARQRAIAFLSV